MFNAHAIAPGTPARHDDRSYHLVGPTPFNFAATPPPGTAITIGNSGLDSVRSTVDAQVLCLSEAQVSGPVLGQLVEYCFCGTNPGPAIFYEQFFFPPSLNAAVCPTSGTSSPWNSIPGLTDFIGTGWVQQFIGRWTGTHPWLADVNLFHNAAVIHYADICHPMFPSPPTQTHLTYGVTTHDESFAAKWQLFNPGSPTTDMLLDFCDAVSPTLMPARTVPQVGIKFASNVVWALAQ